MTVPSPSHPQQTILWPPANPNPPHRGLAQLLVSRGGSPRAQELSWAGCSCSALQLRLPALALLLQERRRVKSRYRNP